MLEDSGLQIINEIVFNQVLVRYNNDNKTEVLVKGFQESGVCWLGGAKWLNKSVMRISICSYKTSYEDIEKSAKEILKIAKGLN